MREKSKISFLKLNLFKKKAVKFSAFLLIAGLFFYTLFSVGIAYAKDINLGTTGDRIILNGNTGIGTTAPQEKLTLGGSSIFAIVHGAPWDHIRMWQDGATGYLDAGGSESGLAFRVDATAVGYPAASYPEIMRLLSNGNVGIGTTNPKSRLQISTAGASEYPAAPGFANASLFLSNLDPLYGLYSGVSGTGRAWLQVGRNDSATYYDMILQPNGGNVGIGNVGPGYKLDVTGNGAFRSGDNSYLYFGPNASWGGSLYVGATPNKIGAKTAQVIASDGNLHIDSGNAAGNDIYLNYYNTGHNIRAFGPLNMGSNQITNLATPGVGSDAATKGYVDSSIVNFTGGSLSGVLTVKTPAIATAITGTTDASIEVPIVNVGTTAGFVPFLHQRAVYNSGYVTHLSLGILKDASAWSGGFFIGLGGSDSNPTDYYKMSYGGNITYSTGLTFLSSGNYNSYAPTLVGGGASGTWGINITGNSGTVAGLAVHAGRNNEANKIVRTDGSGYLQTGYINSSSGDESNNSNPTKVWGTNGSDSYLRTYYTSALSVAYAASAGNANTATTFSTSRSNYKGVTDASVAGELMWKNYGNNHTVTDFSNSTAPNGSGHNNTNAEIAWSPAYPSLMGWNGSNTYGVRVDSARVADSAPANGGTASYANQLNPLSGDSNYKLAYTADGARTNAGEWGRAVMYYVPNGQTYGIRVDRADYANSSGSAANVTGGALSGNLVASNYGIGNMGVYDSTRYQAVWSMGTAWTLPADGTSPGNLYGLAWTHSNAGGQAIGGLSHQLLVMENGATKVALGTGIWTSGNVTAASYIYSSDRNLKKNIATITNPLEKILQLRGVTFNWKKDNTQSVGLIAQEVEKVFPELVVGEEGKKGVQYGNLVAPLIEAVKAQQKEISGQDEKINNLNNAISTLNARLKVLEIKNNRK